jgi:hypothetical protein
MDNNDDLVQIHVDGIHAKQSRIFSTISVPRSTVKPDITPQCIGLVFRHLFPRDAEKTAEQASTAAEAAKELGFRVLRLTTAEDKVHRQIIP